MIRDIHKHTWLCAFWKLNQEFHACWEVLYQQSFSPSWIINDHILGKFVCIPALICDIIFLLTQKSAQSIPSFLHFSVIHLTTFVSLYGFVDVFQTTYLFYSLSIILTIEVTVFHWRKSPKTIDWFHFRFLITKQKAISMRHNNSSVFLSFICLITHRLWLILDFYNFLKFLISLVS